MGGKPSKFSKKLALDNFEERTKTTTKTIRMYKQDAEEFTKRQKASGLNQQDYMRVLINLINLKDEN